MWLRPVSLHGVPHGEKFIETVKTLDHLFHIIEDYTRGEEDTKHINEIQTEFNQAAAHAEAPPAEVVVLGTSPRQNPSPITWKKIMKQQRKASDDGREGLSLAKELYSKTGERARPRSEEAKKKKEKYYLYHDKSSHTIDQCCNMQQLGQAQSAPPNSWGGEEDIKPTEGNRPMHVKVMVEGQRRLIQVITNCSHRRGKKRHHRVVNHIASNLKTKAAILKNCDHLQPWRCEGYPFSLSRPSHYIRKN